MTDVVEDRAARFMEELGVGPTVVLLHSSGLSGRQFRKLTASLVAAGFAVLAPDFAGHGRSPSVVEPAPLSFRDDVAWLVELLRARGPVQLVGHSYGAFVALQAAREASAAVRSMVLFEPVAFGVLGADARKQIEAADSPWGTSTDDHERWLQGFVDYWGGAGAWAGQHEAMRAEFRRVGWAVHQGVRSLAVDTTAASDYTGLTMPITLMSGERSPRAARDVVRTLAATLGQAEIITIPGAGHMAPLSDAELVNAAILAALTRGV